MAIRSLLAALMLVLSSTAPAAAGLRITHIHFDPPGSDDGSKKSLNQERILVRHYGTKANSLKGWKISDKGRNQIYRFPDHIELDGKSRVVLHSGPGESRFKLVCKGGECWGVQHLYWGLNGYVWNNNGDTAKLHRKAKLKDRCSYGGSAASPKSC